MDTSLLKNLGLDTSMNQNDIQLLGQILNTTNSGGKAPKISAKERNNLINKLSSNTTLNEQPKKELKNMNEQEKKIYREELRQKLKNKKNEKKMMRTSNLSKQNMIKNNSNFSEAIEKMTEMIKNNDPSSATTEQLSLEPTNGLAEFEKDLNNNDDATDNNIKQENIINNIINENNETVNNETDNLNDYLN